MKKLFTALGLALLLLTSCFVGACKDEPAIINTITSSVVRITGVEEAHSIFGSGPQNYVCTGFTIAPSTILTAAHCVGEQVLVDGYKATLIRADKYYDLAVLKVPGSTRPSLTLRDVVVLPTEELIGVGYGNGWVFPIAMHERVLVGSYSPTPSVPVGIITQGGYVGGMSGGPIVDLYGNVVGVVQQSNSGLGYGVGVTMIRAFLLDAGVNPLILSGGTDWPN